ncbi:hypothetical protein GCM10010211_32930 [Streptomyces albospinus]|uniref:Lipoprotein n=1 Tax=Streptomyces albospinus TaxID=285515 RepID=A0ABQ2V243_9ACTN|nr:hypothetical protein [Streptomyces albospinus]GGU65225.1 hypothetical protein GCM10010211_32930 [Streptomyces albospinus]
MALVLAAAVVPATGSLAAAATPTIRLDDLSQHPAVKPQTFAVTNHDGLSGLHWSHWGARTAIGKGTMTINTCKPSCAEGHLRILPGARLQVRGVRKDQGQRYYRQYRITDPAFTPQERHAYSRWTDALVPSDFG